MFRRLLAALAGSTFAFGFQISVAAPAAAYNTYDWTFDHNVISYFIDVTSANAIPGWDLQHVNDAAQTWTATPTKLYYEAGGTSINNADVRVQSYSERDHYGGKGGCFYLVQPGGAGTPWYCPARSGEGYAWINLWYNNTTVPVYDQYTAGHEQGHSFGLDHSCTHPSLMQGPQTTYCPNEPYDCASETNCTSTPQQDDVNGVSALYGSLHPPGGLCGPAASVDLMASKLATAAQLADDAPDALPLNQEMTICVTYPS